MNKCLVTKLNGYVNNDSLRKLGELRIPVVSTAASQNNLIRVKFSKDTTITILGDGYFTNRDDSTNKGKTMQVTANTITPCIFSTGTFDLSISDKYSLLELDNGYTTFSGDLNLNIEDLCFSVNLTNLVFYGNNSVSGDIQYLRKLKLRSLSLGKTKVIGDISSLKDMDSLTSLNLNETDITGNLSSIANLRNLDMLALNSTNIDGDISILSGMSKLKQTSLPNTVTGDLAKLPDNITYVESYGIGKTPFTWSSRDSSKSLFAITCATPIDNIDTMLNNLALCQIPAEQKYKTISVVGTRTSASDAAVQTLQSKGYTVSITPAP